MLLNKTYTEQELKFHEVILHRSLTLMDRWLTSTKFLCGNEISIADISAAHELDQIKFLDRDISKYP